MSESEIGCSNCYRTSSKEGLWLLADKGTECFTDRGDEQLKKLGITLLPNLRGVYCFEFPEDRAAGYDSYCYDCAEPIAQKRYKRAASGEGYASQCAGCGYRALAKREPWFTPQDDGMGVKLLMFDFLELAEFTLHTPVYCYECMYLFQLFKIRYPASYANPIMQLLARIEKRRSIRKGRSMR